MEFEKKISIGDVVAIVVAFLAIGGLFLQAKSTAISEEQLRSQVQGISDVVTQLEEQQEQLTDEQVDRLNQGEKLYISQSEMHKQLLDIGRLDRKVTNMFFRSMLLSQSSAQLVLSTEDFDKNILDILDILADGRNINVQLMKVIEFTSVWQNEIQQISDSYDVKMEEVRSAEPISKKQIRA